MKRVKLMKEWGCIFIVDVGSDLDNKRICKNKY